MSDSVLSQADIDAMMAAPRAAVVEPVPVEMKVSPPPIAARPAPQPRLVPAARVAAPAAPSETDAVEVARVASPPRPDPNELEKTLAPLKQRVAQLESALAGANAAAAQTSGSEAYVRALEQRISLLERRAATKPAADMGRRHSLFAADVYLGLRLAAERRIQR